MYIPKDMYGTDHSMIFSTQVNNTLYGTHYNVKVQRGFATHCTVSTNTGVLRERHGIEYDITGTVNRYSNSMTLYCIIKYTQPADATEYVNISLTRAAYGTHR
jgi:hypothetical protein